MRTPVLAANWKMYKTVHDTVNFIKEFRPLVKGASGVEIVLAPPFTAIRAASEAAHGSNIGVGAQDLYWEREGAFTGEVSAGMIKEAGAGYVIIGHSERRRLFGETDEQVGRKIAAAHAAELTPIVCVGETLEERDSDQTLSVLDRQIKVGLDGMTGDRIAALIVAYEPVWCIGTGRNAQPPQVASAHAHIRARLRQWFGGGPADQCRILYGGSVKPDNIRELASLEDVDGALVGGASLDVRGFADIVQRVLHP